jgi:5-methylcytosine-specific restriction enzyme subunit McrC
LNNPNTHITVFEHEAIRFDKGEKRITENQFKALQQYYGSGIPYYSLIYNGVRFNEHVGVIQIGKTLIEVLPKADKREANENAWRNVLISMLKAVGSFDVKVTSESALKIKPNTILDLYFEMFIKEVESILHKGLVKQYRKKESNVNALKGSLQFGKHIQQNLTHQERFYVRHITYDVEHKLHYIIYKTIRLLRQINTNADLSSRIATLLLNFPEMPDVDISASTFESIIYNRKNVSYKKCIEIARLLLLHYHPDVSKGRNNVLALMFDMNKLWEQFVYVSIRNHKNVGNRITAQTSKNFWKPNVGQCSTIRPDIVINISNNEHCVVLDTKWKNLNGYNPSPEDLRQMYVYHQYYAAKRVALVYPGNGNSSNGGYYLHPQTNEVLDMECSVIAIDVDINVKEWQKKICKNIEDWFSVKSLAEVIL